MLKKKIVVILLVVTILSLCVLPASAYSVGSINAAFLTTTQTINSSSKITDISINAIGLSDTTNGFDVTVPFEDTGASGHLGIMVGIVQFTFPEAKYLQGQTYDFSATMVGSQSNNDTMILIPCKEYFWVNLANMELSQFWYNEGDTVPQWNDLLNKIIPYAGLDDNRYQPLLNEQKKIYNNQTISGSIKVPSDYEQVYFSIDDPTIETKRYDNQLTVFIIIRSNYRGSSFQLKDITLTPTGATKQLYAQQEHNEKVEEDLSNIQGGIEEGFSDLMQLPEQEYEFGMDEGSAAIDSIGGAIDDKGPGFFNAVGNLITTVSYTGRECSWIFPSIKIPKIGNLVPEIKLSDEKVIDFTYWIDKIPDKILSTIRYTLSIALICFCFYELYDTIEESLKGKEKKP